jgi:hypothetical protein
LGAVEETMHGLLKTWLRLRVYAKRMLSSGQGSEVQAVLAYTHRVGTHLKAHTVYR